jgi:hypothetical protein
LNQTKLTNKQKERLKVLEPKLKDAISERDYSTAKSLVTDLQALLRPTKHYNRLVKSKNAFYELALDVDKIDAAISGLISNRKVVRKPTRLYLEATAILAICYLRKEEIEKAKPLIREVLTNDDVIKTERTRKLFRIEIVERFNEETALYSLKNKEVDEFTQEELEKEVVYLLTNNKSESELYLSIGRAVPEHTRNLLFQVHQFSILQLPSAERLSLPSPEQKIKDKEVGKTVFKSVKRVAYNSLCDSKSETYKAWFIDGVPSLVLNKGYIRTAIVTSLVNMGIGLKMVIAYVVALVMRIGLDFYCEHYKPLDLMELRGK